MKNLQKVGGIAALYAGAAYVVGMLGFGLIVGWPDDPVKQMAVLMDNQVIMHMLYLIVYQMWSLFLVMLAVALYQRLKAGSLAMMQVTTAIGIIWATVVIASGMIWNIGMDTVVNLYGQDQAQATTVWVAIESVCDGIGGGNEILGGLWILLISWAALRAGELPRVLNYLGVAIGAAGIISVVQALAELFIYIYALGQIVWFVWLGIVMLRGKTSAAA